MSKAAPDSAEEALFNLLCAEWTYVNDVLSAALTRLAMREYFLAEAILRKAEYRPRSADMATACAWFPRLYETRKPKSNPPEQTRESYRYYASKGSTVVELSYAAHVGPTPFTIAIGLCNPEYGYRWLVCDAPEERNLEQVTTYFFGG